MKTNIMKKLLIPVLFLPVMIACNRQGCTDSTATNYSEDAKKDDGSCTYKSQVSFWFNQSTSNAMILLGNATHLYIYLDETLAGEMDPADWEVGPDCGGGNYTLELDMGTQKSKTYNYSVRDQNGAEKFSGMFTNTGGMCDNLQLGG
jgi:hypothetical protein